MLALCSGTALGALVLPEVAHWEYQCWSYLESSLIWAEASCHVYGVWSHLRRSLARADKLGVVGSPGNAALG